MQHELQALGVRLHLEVAAHAFEQRLHGNRPAVHFDDAGIESRDVEQSAEQAAHGAHGIVDVIEQLARFVVHRAWAHRGDEQAERVHRLSQVVARGREEARLRGVRLLGRELLALQVLDQVEILEAQHHRLGERRGRAPRQLDDGDEPDDVHHRERVVENAAVRDAARSSARSMRRRRTR